MEKIRRRPLHEIPELRVLAENWEQWGREYEAFLNGGKQKGDGVNFSWRRKTRAPLEKELSDMTQGHCSFCDSYPIGTAATETIEHYKPKAHYPLEAYDWKNLYFCCNQCQEESERTAYQESLRPDHPGYAFDVHFEFELETGILKALDEDKSNPATIFLQRYGINNNRKRCIARQHVFRDIRNALDTDDDRTRDDFPFRFVYDFAVAIRG